MDAVGNERTKLTANYANGAAIAIFAVGFFAPTVSSLNRGWNGHNDSSIFIGVVCFFVSLGLHIVGRRILKGLKP
ncbi:amino acid transporter [Phyllobacterium leguminum]|uniref:amino acid transporter n=1 Tax=Phyllobacterium leguminum TaxID=314237 RepID=UPI000DA13423|nr:amino acid transporter [Phyllobacterium leguminum]